MLRQFLQTQTFRGLHENPFNVGEDGECSLGKRTIIYGRNGSGKTTFSESLRQAAKTRSQYQWKFWDGTSKRSGSLPLNVVDGIHVYNRFYVEETLGTFLSGAGTSATILKLGSANVAAEAMALKAEGDIARTEIRLSAIDRKAVSLGSNKTAAEESVKSSVIKELAIVDAAKYNTTAFNVTRARALLSADAVLLDESDLNDARTASIQPELAAVGDIATVQLDAATLWDDVSLISDWVVANVAIESLRQDLALARWVEEGIDLHAEGDTCRFCNFGVVTADLLLTYAEHFDNSLKEMRASAAKVEADLDNALDIVQAWQSAFPTLEGVLPPFRKVLKDELDAVNVQVAEFTTWVGDLTASVRQRLAVPLDQFTLTLPRFDREVRLSVAPLNAILADNREACLTQAGAKNGAIDAIQKHCAAEQHVAYSVAIKRLKLAENAKRVVQARMSGLNLELDRNRASQQDTGHMAALLDADLGESFGHDHLSVSVSGDGKGYLVKRGGEFATNLSEGERNSLALLYFLRTLESDDVTIGDDLVVIDDPVTSLDKEALFAAHAVIVQRTENAGQLILLTHDYEFFRLNVVSRQSAYRVSLKKRKDNVAAELAFPRVEYLEIVSKTDPQESTRSSTLRALPSKLLVHPSEYHYLFWRVGTAVLKSDDMELPLLGNAGRRLLEGFISFKAPNGDSFQSKITLAASSANVPKELSERVVRFAHGTSHREEANPTVSLDFPAVEDELQRLLQFINLCDPSHFERMSSAVDIDLRPAPGVFPPSGQQTTAARLPTSTA